jgi:uncharacterized membrane protein
MKTIGWMVGGTVFCGLLALWALGQQARAEVLFGMIAPVLVAIATFVAIERTYRAHPERVTSLMAAAFGAKMVFFGAYVVVMLRLLALRPMPFIVSFAACFIALQLIEGFSLRRLFAGEARGFR